MFWIPGTQDPGRVSHGDAEGRERRGHDRSGTDNAVVTDVRHDERRVTDPAVSADGDAPVLAALIANGCLQSFEVVLLRSAHYVNTTGDESVIANLTAPDVALGADVDAVSKPRVTLREESAKADRAFGAGVGENDAEEGKAQVGSDPPRNQAEKLGTGREAVIAPQRTEHQVDRNYWRYDNGR